MAKTVTPPRRARSHAFPRSATRVTIRADFVPAWLKKAALAKCARENKSLRSVILTYLARWVKT